MKIARYVNIYAYLCICVCVCLRSCRRVKLNVYINKLGYNTQTDRQTHTHTHTYIYIYRQTFVFQYIHIFHEIDSNIIIYIPPDIQYVSNKYFSLEIHKF